MQMLGFLKAIGVFKSKFPEKESPRQLRLPDAEFERPLKPFLRWAGGKSRITNLLAPYAPANFGRYWEPFLGSAALYFHLHPKSAYLSDSNEALINCYRHVRDHPDAIYRKLQVHAKKTSEKHYYAVRDQYNKSSTSVEQSARFIYLNKSSFNGIFRVNTKGEYNVPYGFKKSPALPTLDELKEISDLLKLASLAHHSFEALESSDLVRRKDFVYIDPPYPPLTATSFFTHYTSERFSWEDQETVGRVANALSARGCYVMVTNTNIPAIRKIYAGWNLYVLPVIRWIAANGKRHKVKELIITNYDA